MRRRDLGRSREVFAGVNSHFDGAVPVGIPEDLIHVGQAAGVKNVNIGTNQVGDAGECADRLESLRFRGASSAADRWIRVGSDDGDGLDFGRVERQQVTVILEERQALQCAVEGNGAIRDRVGGVGRIELRMVEEAVAQFGAELAHQFVVEGGFFHRAIFDRGQQSLGVHETRIGHFQIEAVVGRADGVISSVPVRHQNALESPLALEHLQVEKLVLCGVDAVDQVVRVHNRVHVPLGDGCLKGRQVDFAHGPLVHVGADVVPVVLLIVQGIMLDRGDNALGLNALDKGNHKGRIQIGILGEVLEVAAGYGRSGDVDPRAEQEIDAAGTRILAQAFADLARQLRVPRGGQRNAAGVGCGRSPGAHA